MSNTFLVCRRLLSWGLVLTTVVLAGCNQGPRVVRVSGTVSHQGKPVPHLIVNFVPDDGRPSWGSTDEQGHFTLHYDRQREGAVTGWHKVYVQFKPANAKEEQDIREGRLRPLPDWPAIREKYGSLETTQLRVEVKEEDQVIDLPLD